MVLIRVAVVGGPGVGKTALVRQFVSGTFSPRHSATRRKQVFFPSAFINDRVYELQLSDLPPISLIPSDSLQEWAHCPGMGLRVADAYILVFDLSQPDTFQTVLDLHNQLSQSRPSAPVVVVGAKQDLVPPGGEEATREIGLLIKKQWHSPYVESSSKCNWRVIRVFQELVNLIDANFASEQSTKGRGKNSSGSRNGLNTLRTRSHSPRPTPSSRHCALQ